MLRICGDAPSSSCFGQGGVRSAECRRRGNITHPCKCTQPNAIGADDGLGERQGVDIYLLGWALDAILHPVRQLGRTGDKGCAWLARHLRDGGVNVGRSW
jgi:hypothetical protein